MPSSCEGREVKPAQRVYSMPTGPCSKQPTHHTCEQDAGIFLHPTKDTTTQPPFLSGRFFPRRFAFQVCWFPPSYQRRGWPVVTRLLFLGKPEANHQDEPDHICSQSTEKGRRRSLDSSEQEASFPLPHHGSSQQDRDRLARIRKVRQFGRTFCRRNLAETDASQVFQTHPSWLPSRSISSSFLVGDAL